MKTILTLVIVLVLLNQVVYPSVLRRLRRGLRKTNNAFREFAEFRTNHGDITKRGEMNPELIVDELLTREEFASVVNLDLDEANVYFDMFDDNGDDLLQRIEFVHFQEYSGSL